MSIGSKAIESKAIIQMIYFRLSQSVPYLEFYRGKGDYYRLGTDSNSQVMEPHPLETITKKVTQIAVGSLHCLALTETGEVCSK